MCIVSVGNFFCMCGAGDDASYVRFGETKDKYFNRSLRHGTEMRHRNLRSDSVWYILGMGHDFRIFDLIIEYRLGCAIIF